MIPYAGKLKADNIGNMSRFGRASREVSPEVAKLRDARIRLGVTQEKLGKTIGVSGKAVSEWEKGHCSPTDFNLQCWKDALRRLGHGSKGEVSNGHD